MIYRIDVRTTPAARGGEAAGDPVGEALRHQIAEFGSNVGRIETSRIFLIDTDADTDEVARIARELLADPVVEQSELVPPAPAASNGDGEAASGGGGESRIEIHLKPGVMDPVAASTEMAIRDMGLPVREVRTGRSYSIQGSVPREELQRIAQRVLANGVIESVYFEPFVPERFARGHDYAFSLRHVAIRDLTEAQLAKLSREGHLFLSPAEMKAIQDYYRKQDREPTDVELETIAQTWSEHCVHKTLKSAVDVEVRDASGKAVGKRHYDNLIKETIFSSTQQLMAKDKSGFCLSVFKDNAGVIAFDDVDAVCFKVETTTTPAPSSPTAAAPPAPAASSATSSGRALRRNRSRIRTCFASHSPTTGRVQGSGFRVQKGGPARTLP